MKAKTLSLLALALFAAPAMASTGAAPTSSAHSPALDHGKLAWFDGTYEQALAEAAKTKKLVFMDFWTDW